MNAVSVHEQNQGVLHGFQFGGMELPYFLSLTIFNTTNAMTTFCRFDEIEITNETILFYSVSDKGDKKSG